MKSVLIKLLSYKSGQVVTRENTRKKSISTCCNIPIGWLSSKIGLYLVADIKTTHITSLTWMIEQCPLPSLANSCSSLRICFRYLYFCLS